MYRINRQPGAFSLLHCSKKASLDFSLAHAFLRMVVRSLVTDSCLACLVQRRTMKLSVAVVQTLLQAAMDPPGRRQRCSRSRTGSNSSVCPSMPSALPRTISTSRLRRLSDQDLQDIGVPPRASAEDACGHQLAYRRGPATPEPAARSRRPKTPLSGASSR
jgi:hypothetical protein